MSAPAFQLHPAFSPEVAHRAPPAGHWPPTWAVAWGDDRFGLWADLEILWLRSGVSQALPPTSGVVARASIEIEKPRVVQRFRWIEPGSFLMGSPEAEPKRNSNEGPQHRVKLTQGFWLADTACTQALWLAVVGGENPSRFKGSDDLPVENVSWDDVMEKFMPKLQALLPQGVEATLPSEAQWEYACRAGTKTPFSFGEQTNPEQMNCDDTKPYNNGPQSECRERTVLVKALPANPWGLFQMHGNVWEWCFDEKRPYAEGAVVDPMGGTENGLRILRGGSWNLYAWFARAAHRSRLLRDSRYDGIGFRVALRFKPSQGA